MRKEEKTQIIESLAAQLEKTPNFYLADISGLNAEKTALLRRTCFEKEIKLVVVKNTLLRKALEKRGIEEVELLFPILEGPSAVMFTEVAKGQDMTNPTITPEQVSELIIGSVAGLDGVNRDALNTLGQALTGFFQTTLEQASSQEKDDEETG